MTDSAGSSAIRGKAMDLLARREHSVRELRGKLRSRGFEEVTIDTALADLVAEGLLSDERFTESYVNRRRNAGIGPLKIRLELQQRGIGSELAERYIVERDGDWNELMAIQRERRFGTEIPDDYGERMKQARFLQNRGFSPEAVMRLFR